MGAQSGIGEIKNNEAMQAKQLKSALIMGASGLVGKSLLEVILSKGDYTKVKVVLRRPINLTFDKRVKIIVITDFEALDAHAEDLLADDVFCCLGSTMNKAGSKSSFEKSDLVYPLKIATINQSNPNFKNYLIITAQGANEKSLFYYNQVKGRCEQSLLALNLPGLKVFRPSLLLGVRIEKRWGEFFFKFLIQSVSIPLKLVGISTFWTINATTVANAMLKIAMNEKRHTVFYDVKSMIQLTQR